MDFIKELFIGRKIYLTTDLPKDITKVLISKKPGYLMGGAASPMRGITAKEYEILIAISKVSVRVATRRNCIEVTDLIGFF